MKIHYFPFININALTDVFTGEIFISPSAPSYVLVDEIAHILSGNIAHDKNWEQQCLNLAGYIPLHNSEFDGTIPLAANIGNISGIQNILTDYFLLQSYRRFSQRILGNEGHWEVLGDNKIHLYPTPKGSFPVVVLYIPVVTSFRTPANKQLVYDMILAESMIMLGHARGKFAGIPSPDGGSITLDGADLKTAGLELKKQVLLDAVQLSTDPGGSAIYRY